MISARLGDFKGSVEGRAILLSSGRGWTTEADSSLILDSPNFSLDFLDGTASVVTKEGKKTFDGDPLAFLGEMLDQGYYAVGYIGYEYYKYLNIGLSTRAGKEGWDLPDLSFLFYEEDKIHEAKFEAPDDMPAKARPSSLRANMSREYYRDMVNRARRYIERGDIYQANLSQRFEVDVDIRPEQFLSRLYRAQPVPFACLIDLGNFQLISGSMELFLQKKGRRITTRPIKGTRRRGIDESEDEALRQELLNSEKERAENLMIVDLMRNDLGRMCEFGSVRVNRLFDIEPYTTLFQMVSEVEGKLRGGVTISQIIKHTFPPGSVTGAPKYRAMEIIDELEPHLRGPYCGAIGFFRPDGDFTLSVAIRVLVASQGKGTFWVGGGIMWDSVPELEYEETLVKAEAIMRALG